MNWSISGSSYFLKNRNLYITPCGFELPTILLKFLECKDDRYTQLTLRLVFNVLMGKNDIVAIQTARKNKHSCL